MSTRCLIGMKLPNGKIKTIYCHFDGYPKGVGKDLKKHYTTTAKIKKLMALGDISSLGKEIGSRHEFFAYSDDECTAYGRDRGEKGTKARIVNDYSELLDIASGCWADYIYVWDGKKWIQKK